MAHLIDVFPNPDSLIAMPVADVAGVVLRLAYDFIREHNGRTIHPQAILEQVHGPRGQHERGYPQQKKDPAERALNAAWNYLQRNGLVIPEPGPNGANGHHTLSDEAQRIANNGDLRSFVEAATFPPSLLHPAIAEDVWQELARGSYDTAVFKSLRAVEEAVRAAGGYPRELIGVDLMRTAFGAQGPLTRAAEPVPEQQALAHLFAGAIGYYKNPQSHRTVNVEPKAAREAALLASHLLRIVDERKP